MFQVHGIRENVHGSMVDDGKEDLNSFDLSWKDAWVWRDK